MKRMITIVLTLILGLSALAVPAVAEGAPQIDFRCGLLTMLNIGEEEYAAFLEARYLIGDRLIREGYASLEPLIAPPPEGENPPAPEGAPDGEKQLPSPGEGPGPKPIIVYYDTLDAMLMALNAGDIGSMELCPRRSLKP